MDEKLTSQNIDSPVEELSFDMRLYFYRELHQIRLRLIEYSASGELSGWFEMLEREYMHVVPHIFPHIYDTSKSEEHKLEKEENEKYEICYNHVDIQVYYRCYIPIFYKPHIILLSRHFVSQVHQIFQRY